MPNVQSVNGLSGDLTVVGTQNVSVSSGGTTITITGPNLTAFASTAELNAVSGTLQTQINSKSDVGHTHSHSSLTGLTNDDHAQYSLVAGTRAFTGTVAGVTPTDTTHLTTKGYVDGEVSSIASNLISVSGSLQTQVNAKSDVGHVHDHGVLTGLGDDDHTHYSLVTGMRGFTGTVSGVDPTLGFHLATKFYIDGTISTLRGEMLSVSGSLQGQINQLRSELVALSGSCCTESFGQLVSIDQLGDSENMAKSSAVDIGIGNVWSTSMWVKPNSSDPTSGMRLIEIQPDSGGANVIRISTTTSPTTLLVNTIDSGNTNLKLYNYNSILTAGVWSFLVLTWDGTNLKLYHQGSLLTPDTIQQDNSGSMSSTNRLIDVGGLRIANPAASFDGRLHSYAIWNVTLSASAISELYNAGEGASVDYSSNGTNYTSSGNLLHWWRLGFDSSDIGKDYGLHTSLIDVLDDATGIDASDIVSDYPGM